MSNGKNRQHGGIKLRLEIKEKAGEERDLGVVKQDTFTRGTYQIANC